jgi:hypothetical protein
MGTKTLRQMSDTQFTAWLRGQGARGSIGVVKTAPGELTIPIDERVRVLNTLEDEGFYIPNVMGTPPTGAGPDPVQLERASANIDAATTHLREIEAAVAELGEIDPRVNMRVSIHGALELVDLLRGAIDHALREPKT